MIKLTLWFVKFMVVCALLVMIVPFYLVILAVFPKTGQKLNLLIIGLWDWMKR